MTRATFLAPTDTQGMAKCAILVLLLLVAVALVVAAAWVAWEPLSAALPALSRLEAFVPASPLYLRKRTSCFDCERQFPDELKYLGQPSKTFDGEAQAGFFGSRTIH